MAWNTPIRRGPWAPRERPLPTQDGRVTFERAVERFIESHLSPKTGRPYGTTTKQNIRANLLGGRLTNWRLANGIRAADEWTAEHAAQYLTWYQQEIGADSQTVKKVQTQLRQFADFCAESLGYPTARGPSLTELRISSAADQQRSKEPPFTHAEVTALLDATGTPRDRLIICMLLYTGMRPSELIALEEQNVRLDRNPPVVEVRGSVHDPTMTKSHAGFRDIPLTIGQTVLPRMLRDYLTDSRRPMGSYRLFLGDRRERHGNIVPLTLSGLQSLLDRVEGATGIHCNPYRFRHTFCTWCADAGMHMLHLQQLMGHASNDMVAYYYRGRTSEAVLAAAARVRF